MLSILVGNNKARFNTSVVKGWNDKQVPYHTSIDVKASDVYSISAGSIIFIGRSEDGKLCVNVQVNSDQLIRYCNLSSVDVKPGMTVSTGQKLGNVKDVVKVEYCTHVKGTSKWPVRIYGMTFYKQDPTYTVCGMNKLDTYTECNFVVDNHREQFNLTDEESREYSNNNSKQRR